MDLIVSQHDGVWRAQFGPRSWRCAIGEGGTKPKAKKREGDGATPLGCYPMRRVIFRPDRLAAPATRLPVAALSPEDGWCDDPAHPAYNSHVRLPFAAGHERLWRDDGIYDLIAILGHNDDPPVAGMGSAIFLHVARPDYAPTLGCVALALPDLLAFLKESNKSTRLCVEAG
jgi:L,D-peptidoglycan transpeptidase YkuD (ErfK/YbiS/YcfS/YnhG family)